MAGNVIGSASIEVRADLDKLKGDLQQGERLAQDSAGRAGKGATIRLGADTSGIVAAGKAADQQLQAIVTNSYRLNRAQVLETSHVIRSLVDSVVAGQTPIRALLQEAPRIGQIAAFGEGGFAALAKGALGLVAPLAAPLAGFGALAVAAGGAALAFIGFEKSQHDVATTLNGLGRASGASSEQIDAIAGRVSASGQTTLEGARKLQEALLSTGEVGSRALEPATEAVLAYSKATGVSQDAAIKALTPLFKDPAAGAADLNHALGFLTDKQFENIRATQQQGDQQGALIASSRLLTTALAGQAGAVDVQASAWQRLATRIGNAFDRLKEFTGASVAHAVGQFSGDEELGALRRYKAGKATTADLIGPLRQFSRGGVANGFDNSAIDQRFRALDAQAKGRGAAVADRAADDARLRREAADPKGTERERLRNAIKAVAGDLKGGQDTPEQARAATAGLQKQLADLDRQPKGPRGPSAQTLENRQLELEKRSSDQGFDAQAATLKAQKDELQARRDGVLDVQKRADLDSQIAAIGVQEVAVAQNKRVSDAAYALKLKQIDASAFQRVKNEAEAVKSSAAAIAAIRQETRDRDTDNALRRQDLARRAALVGYDDEISAARAGLARTAEERRQIEVAQFDEDRRLQRSQRKLSLDESDASPDDKARDLAGFDAATAAKREELRRRTLGIGESYADGLTTSIANQGQNLEVSAISGAGDALVSLATGATDARSAITSFAKGLITDVTKAAVERFVEKPLADRLFPATKLPGVAKPTVTVEGLAGAAGSTTALTGLATSATAAAAALGSLTLSAGAQTAGSLFSPSDLNTAPPAISDLVKLAPLLGFATGGKVSGPGTSTSDSIPAMLSTGEFVVPAKATAKHLRLLESIRADRVPGFADGGLVGFIPAPKPASSTTLNASINGAGRAPGITYNLQGAVLHDQLWQQIKSEVAQGKAEAVLTSTAHTNGTIKTVQERQSRRARYSRGL